MKWRNLLWHRLLRRPYELARVIDVGDGKTVLLIHGLAGSSSAWTPILKYLDAGRWHVIGFDLLGFGASPKPAWSKYDVNAHAQSILASLLRQEKKEPIVIIGHSMGCLIASHIATIRPNLVERLVLYEPPLFVDAPEFRSHSRRRSFYFALYKTIAKRPQLVFTYSRIAAKLVRKLSMYTVNSETWNAFDQSLHNTIMDQRAYDELKNIHVPTDIIHGRLDFVVTRTDVKKMLAANPFIKYHSVTEIHGVSKKAAHYIARLLKTHH